MITEKQAYNDTLKYFNNDELATKVWLDKYALRDRKSELQEYSPVDMYRRIAEELFRIEQTYPNPLRYNEIEYLLINNRFIPGGSSLFGIGNPYQYTSLANCFVIGNVEDSYLGLLQTDAEQALLMKRRGGVGHDISHLRPKGSTVQNAAKTSTGAVSFMSRYSNTTREVGQGGRRGALMLTMLVTHPDIFDFVTAKDDTTKITGANISVKITDEFLTAVVSSGDFILRWPHIDRITDKIYDVKDLKYDKTVITKTGYILRKIKARTLWNIIIKQAHKNGEPGLLFWNTILENSPADCYEMFQTKSTNPCGEVPLSTYDSCRLGSMILPSYVKNPFTEGAFFNMSAFIQDVKKAYRLMDNIVDLEKERIENIIKKIEKDYMINNIEYLLWQNIKESLINGRRVGLGTLGLADVFAMLGITYGDAKSIVLGERIHKSLALASYEESISLAKERGSFPVYEHKREYNHSFIKMIYHNLGEGYKEDYNQYGRRNIGSLSIAPTGTLSILTGYSSGIEPVFQLFYERKRKVEEDNPNKSIQDDNGDWWEKYKVIHPAFKQWILENSTIKMNVPDDYNLKECAKNSPYHNSTANDIVPILKIHLQASIQKWIDHSISVTHNVPEKSSLQDIDNIYMEAWMMSCKGATVYRQNSRLGVLTSGIPEEKFKRHDSIKRPKEVDCDIYITTSKGQKYVVCIGIVDNHPFEVFAFDYEEDMRIIEDHGKLIKIKKGHYNLIIPNGQNIIIEDITSKMKQSEEDRTRMISTALRHGADIKFVVEQLRKSKGDITTFSKVIARVLSRYLKSETLQKQICPVCNAALIYEGGCNVCKSCGFSKCE